MEAFMSWTGGRADALRECLRVSNEVFAEHLRVGVRTVANWRLNPQVVPKSAYQEVLERALERAPEGVPCRPNVAFGMFAESARRSGGAPGAHGPGADLDREGDNPRLT